MSLSVSLHYLPVGPESSTVARSTPFLHHYRNPLGVSGTVLVRKSGLLCFCVVVFESLCLSRGLTETVVGVSNNGEVPDYARTSVVNLVTQVVRFDLISFDGGKIHMCGYIHVCIHVVLSTCPYKCRRDKY